MKQDIIQVGNGKVAGIHRLCLPRHADVTAVVVPSVEKHKERARSDDTLDGVLITDSLRDAMDASESPVWDIASDDGTHYAITERILSMQPDAKIILSKSPYKPELIDRFLALEKKFPGARITILENYSESSTMDRVNDIMKNHGIRPREVWIEFTKNRVRDIKNGRFIHQDIGVLGYESSHMLTILSKTGVGEPRKISNIEVRDLDADGALAKQGAAYFDMLTENSSVHFYVSMDGRLKFPLKELGFTENIQYGDERRYRILVIKDGGKKITVEFDPVPGLPRLHTRVLSPEGEEIVHDNTMARVLDEQICHVTGGACRNPFPLRDARKLAVLDRIFRAAEKGEDAVAV